MSGAGLRPDLPGKAHGIVSIDPPTVQCDGCGHTFTHPRMTMAIILSGITFNRLYPDLGRLCRGCWAKVL